MCIIINALLTGSFSLSARLTNILKAAHVPCTSITRPVPHASWALVSLRDYRDSHLAAAAFERAAMAEEAHPGAAEAHPGAEGGIPTRGAEEASDEGSSQAGEDGGVKQEGSAQKKKGGLCMCVCACMCMCMYVYVCWCSIVICQQGA